MEQAYCTAVFWPGGEKIDLKGLKPNEVRCLTVTGEKITDLAFLSEYPNLEMLTLDGKFSGVEALSNLEQLNELSLWLSEPVNWENVHLSALRIDGAVINNRIASGYCSLIFIAPCTSISRITT